MLMADVVVNTVGKQPRSKKKYIVFVSLILILTIILVLAIASNYTSRQDTKVSKSDSKQKMVEKFNSLIAQGKYKEAQEYLIKSDISSQEKQILQASSYINSGQLAEALYIYKDLDKKNMLSQNTAENAAETAINLNNVNDAVYFYEKAIELARKNNSNPVRDSHIKSYTSEIESLRNGRKLNN